MAYDDRDYYRDQPRFEMSQGVPRATLGLIILVCAGFVVGAMLANTLSFSDPQWFLNAISPNGDERARMAYRVLVLTNLDVAPWVGNYQLQPWKVLTSWLVSPTLISAAFGALGVYIVGRSIEDLMGTRRFLISFVALCVLSSLLASIGDSLLLPRKPAVIMGPMGGVTGLFAALYWMVPKNQLLMSFRARNVYLSILLVVIGWELLSGFFAPEVALSLTQSFFGAAIGFGVSYAYFKRGAYAGFTQGEEQDDRASWGKPNFRGDDQDEEPRKVSFFGRRKEEPTEERQEGDAEERKRVDVLLEKISKNGIDSLSRSERKFLDSASKKMKK